MKKIRIYISLLVATIFILSMFTPLFLANTIDNGKKGTTGVNYRSDYEGFRLNRDIFILDSNYLEDTKLTSYYPDYNHGARTSLNVDAEKNLVLMRWNLTDYEGFVLLDATLRLYQTDQRNIGDTITMTLTPFLNDSWVEGTGLGNVNGPDGATYNEWDYSNGALENTWNGYPNGPGDGDFSLPDSIMADSIKLLDEYIEFNVTEMIQKYLDGVLDWRNGFFMTSDLLLVFPSSESLNNAPELKLTILEQNNPPYDPSNPDPSDGAIDVDISSDLSWDGGDPDYGDPVYYYIFFGTDSNPPFLLEIGPYPWNVTRISWNPEILEYQTQYYWRIIPYDDEVCGLPGPIWSFTTSEEPNDPPYVPSNPNPANGILDVDINADLSWTGGDPDPGDTVTYDVYFGTTFPPPQVAWDHGDTSYTLGVLWMWILIQI